jgi:LuxR family maltose regulon positive regulatory protein
LWLQALGRQDQAVTELIRAVQLSEPEGFIRLFVDYGEPVMRLLVQVASQKSSPPKAKALLDTMMDGSPAASTQKLDTRPLLEPLTDQEQRILRLMAAGLSNREIADELFLSVNTIKVYASRMYAKLSVHRRGEAVAIARELDLI